MRNKRIPYYLGIGLISAATLLLELALTRVFSVQQFYHFAFMAISLALLGAGASGSLLSVWGRRRLSSATHCLLFGLTTIAAYLLINYLPFDSFRIAYEQRQLLFLALYFLAAAAPFIFAGLLVGGELSHGEATHRIYGANLIGSAAGSAASLPALDLFGGTGTVLLAAVLGGGSGLLFVNFKTRRGLTLAGLSLALAGAGILAIFIRPPFLQLQISPYKSLPTLSQAFDAQHTLTEWSASGRVDVVESSTIHQMPGLSLASPVGLPPQAGLMLDGDNLMPITGLDPDSEQAQTLADYLPNGVAFRLRPGGQTLVVEAGTGKDVLFALAGGAEAVTAAEDNGLVIGTVRRAYGDFTHYLYDDRRVAVEKMSGRVFARQTRGKRFDVAIISLSDPHRPVTSGAYSLTENYVYTVDAMRDYLAVLAEDGLLMVTRWAQTPPSESGRAFATLAAALRQQGKDPAQHLIAFRTVRTVTVLAGKRPFRQGEIAAVRDFLAERSFDAVYYPGIQPEALNRFNKLPEPIYHNLFSQLLHNPEQTVAAYRFDIRPPSDNWPFFFHYFKWRQTPEILATLGVTWQPFGGSGYFVLIALLLLVVLASAVLILGPLLWQRWRRAAPAGAPASRPRPAFWRLRVFLYFAGLGLAFLFVEISLAQRFILVLDEPVIALAAVLASVLLFSGLGSITVRRWRLAWGLGALVILIALYPWLLPPLTRLALGTSLPVRLLLTVLAMAPLGYLMGLPFAGGVAVLERYDPALIPWAWAINGSFSVISAVLAVMVALSWGFSAVLWLGAAAYGLAWLSLGRFSGKWIVNGEQSTVNG